MAHIGINEVIGLKKQIEERFGVVVYLHDSCGGQFFSTDSEISDEMRDYLVEFFGEKRMNVKFPSDGRSFVIT